MSDSDIANVTVIKAASVVLVTCSELASYMSYHTATFVSTCTVKSLYGAIAVDARALAN